MGFIEPQQAAFLEITVVLEAARDAAQRQPARPNAHTWMIENSHRQEDQEATQKS